MIDALEKRGYAVIPAFSYAIKDTERGNKGSGEVVCDYFIDDDHTPRISAMIKLQSFFLGSDSDRSTDDQEVARSGVDILKRLDVPVFAPVTSFHRTIEQWEDDPDGVGTSIAWSIALPEFEGVIEPLIVGGASNQDSRVNCSAACPLRSVA